MAVTQQRCKLGFKGGGLFLKSKCQRFLFRLIMSTYKRLREKKKKKKNSIKEQAAARGINAFHFLYTCWILCAQRKHYDGPRRGYFEE